MNGNYYQLHQHFTKPNNTPKIIFYDGYDFRLTQLEDGRIKLEDRDINSNWVEVKQSPFLDLWDAWRYISR